MRTRITIFVGLLATIALTTGLGAHSGGPRPRHTGGFQEKTCTSCHVDYALNQGTVKGGVFYLAGVPKSYSPGASYPVTIVLGHPGQLRWGFQLASRFVDSEGQAGKLVPVDELTQVREADGLQYIEHTESGAREDIRDGPVEFHLNWVAPQAGGAVLFNAAGNAADDSGDPKGDYIYTASAFSNTSQPLEAASSKVVREKRRLDRISRASTVIHIPAPVDLKPGSVEVNIQHRFLQGLGDSSPGNAFGIDSGANINLGANVALTEKLSLGVSRSRWNNLRGFRRGLVAFSGTYEIRTEDESFWNLSVFGGLEGESNFTEHYSPFLQLAAAFDYDRLRFYTAPTLVLNSRKEQEVEFLPDPINPRSNDTFSLGLGVDAALSRRLSVAFEYVPRLAGFGGFGEKNPTIATGVKIRSWGHVFTIVASTSRTFTPGQYAVNSEDDFSLGFNIYRRIR